MEISELSIAIVLLLILVLFFFIGFVKGLLKTTLALCALAVSGFSAWWGYNHGPSWLGQFFETVPDYLSVVSASLCGAISFFLLYRVFYFIVNPFESDEECEKKGWNFGIPAALISVVLAAVFVCFAVNRMRETDQLDQLKESMTYGLEKAKKRSGIHQFVIEKLGHSSAGKLLFSIDPLWDDERAKLTKLVVLFFQNGGAMVEGNPTVTEFLRDESFQIWVIQQDDLIAAMKARDASALWSAEAIEVALTKGKFREELKGVKF